MAKARKKEGRLRRHWRVAGELREDPKRVKPLLRDAVLNVWRARGGGLFGLGYIVAFCVFEVQFFVTEIGEAQGVVDFVSSQLIEYVLRFGLQSIINGFLALLWPVYVINAFGIWGIGGMIVAYFGFERLLRPTIEQHFPELKKEPKPSE